MSSSIVAIRLEMFPTLHALHQLLRLHADVCAPLTPADRFHAFLTVTYGSDNVTTLLQSLSRLGMV